MVELVALKGGRGSLRRYGIRLAGRTGTLYGRFTLRIHHGFMNFELALFSFR